MKKFINNNKVLSIVIILFIILSVLFLVHPFERKPQPVQNNQSEQTKNQETQKYVDCTAIKINGMKTESGKIWQDPSKSPIRFVGNNYDFSEGDFDCQTRVGYVYYTLNGSTSDNPDGQIFIDYYFQGVYNDNPFTAEDVANNTSNGNFVVESRFEAPDPISKKPAYFLVASSVDQDGINGRVTIMKFADIGEDVYSAVFSKRINSKGMDSYEAVEKWLADKVKTYGDALGNIGPDDSWLNYFLKYKSLK
jgi:hypothetical protein